ncbi:MAG: hypothetical protein Q9195_006637 [Heterodermia aff. obscurata]
MIPFFRHVANELGLTTLSQSSRDVYLLLLTRFIRMFAYGSSTLILALYFEALGIPDTQIGLFMTLTLVGDIAISLGLTIVADRLGRRRVLTLGALLMALSGVVFATTSNYWVLLLAAILGVISPSGSDIGPFRAVEESTLAHLSNAKTRPEIFAWYVIIGTAGTASGTLICGFVTQALQSGGWGQVDSYRITFWAYAAIGLLKAAINLLLSRQCEPDPPAPQKEAPGPPAADDEQQPLLANRAPASKLATVTTLSPNSRFTLLKLCGLFGFDSLGSGMVATSLITFFMKRKFSILERELGTISSAAWVFSCIGTIFAASIAKRIGLIKTMVLTHLPSVIFLILFPFPASLTLTVILLVARASLSSMDQAPRSAFLSAVVLPQERTAVMGIVNTVNTMSQSSGPLITGALAGHGRFWIAFVVAGALKGLYDLGLLAMFVHTKLEGDENGQESSERTDEEEERGTGGRSS